MRIGVVIAAGGTGVRFGAPEGKQLAVVAGKPVVVWSLEAVAAIRGVQKIVVACHPDRVAEFKALIGRSGDYAAPIEVVAGGGTRQASVAAGLAVLPDSCAVIIVHDGARPLATTELFERAVAALASDLDAEGVVVGHPAVDTLKHVDSGRVIATPDRTLFWAIQTPQVFRSAGLRQAYAVAGRDGFLGTDDASLVERLGGRVLAVEGPRDNLKVTHAEDLPIAEVILASHMRERAGGSE